MPASAAALVYGTLTVGALLAAESAQSETYLETVAGVVLALLIYWLARAYADFTGERLAHRERFDFGALGRTLGNEVLVLAGAVVPLLALLLCWAIGASLGTAVTAAVWTSAGIIVVIEVVAGVRAKLSGRELALQAGFGAVLGLLMITLKLVLH